MTAFKTSLTFLICFSLGFHQPLFYASALPRFPDLPPLGDSDHVDQRTLRWEESLSQKPFFEGALPAVREELLKLGEMVETNQIDEYMASHPREAKDRDFFLMTHQTVEVIEHHIRFDKNHKKHYVENIVDSIPLSDFKPRSQDIITDLYVSHDPRTRELIFEGRKSNAPVLRQRVPDLDVIDFAGDQSMLMVLDRNKGLLMTDMLIAKSYIGMAPLVFTRVPLHPEVQDFINTHPEEASSLLVEFVTRATRPPDILPSGDTNTLDKNFRGEWKVTAGDVILSHTSNNESDPKRLLQVVTYDEMRMRLDTTIRALDIMMSTVSPHLLIDSLQSLYSLFQEREAFKKPNATGLTVYELSLSALFTQNELQKLLQIRNGLMVRRDMLAQMTPRDQMLFQEWQTGYEKLKSYLSSHPGSNSRVQLQTSVQDKTGKILQTHQIHKLFQETQSEKQEKAKALRTIAHILESVPGRVQNSVTGPVEWVKRNKLISVTALGGVATYQAFHESFIHAINYISPLFFNINSYQNSMEVYAVTGLSHALGITIALPASVFLCAAAFVPAVKILKSIAPERLSLFSKVFHPKGRLQEMVEKWDRVRLRDRVFTAGLKITSLAMEGVYNHIISLSGRSTLQALKRGLNPFTSVSRDSDMGQAAGLSRDRLLGFNRPFDKESKAQKESLQIMNQFKNEKINTITWLLAAEAVSGNTNISVAEITFNGLSTALPQMEGLLSDPPTYRDMLWVMTRLRREISRHLEEVDIQKTVNNIDPVTLVRYYGRAKELAGQLDRKPTLRRRFFNFMNSPFIQWLRVKTNYRGLAPFFNWNADQCRMCKNLPTTFVGNETLKHSLIDHSMYAPIAMLAAERAYPNLLEENLMAVDSGDTFSTEGRHYPEAWANLYIWWVPGVSQNALSFQTASSFLSQVYSGITDKEGQASGPASNYTPLVQHREPLSPAIQKDSQQMGKNITQYIWPYFSAGTSGNMGQVSRRMYLSRVRTLQIALLGFVFTRGVLTDAPQTVWEMVEGYALFHCASFLVFGWPWIPLMGGAMVNTRLLAANKAKLQSLHLSFSEISQNLMSGEEDIYSSYEAALRETLFLYTRSYRQVTPDEDQKEAERQGDWARANHILREKTGSRPRPLKKLRQALLNSGIREANPPLYSYLNRDDVKENFSDLPVTRDIPTIQNTSKVLMNLLKLHPPLVHTKNKLMDNLLSLVIGGSLTWYLNIRLSKWTFEEMSWITTGGWLMGTFALILALSALHSRWARKHVYNWTNLYYRYNIYSKEGRAKWRETYFGKNSPYPTKKFREVFYSRFLQVGARVSRLCQGIF